MTKRISAFIAIFLLSFAASAQDLIELPQEELAKESVLPIFDRPVSVKARNVVTEGRFDVNLLYGMALSEPIFNVNRFGASIYYNTSENHAFGLLFAKNNSGESSYAKQLFDKYKLEFSRAPAPDASALIDWDYKMFYGKMSLTKETVFNLSLYTTLAAGVVKYTHKSYPALAPGIGQKFYFSRNFAVRFDLRLFMHQAPIPFLDGFLKSTDPKPTLDQFGERLTFTTMLDAGLSYLF